MSASGLAAVHAAAMNSAAIPPQPTASAPAPAPAAPAAPAAAAATTVADLVSAYPDLCTQLRAAGATAERTRLLGIEAHAMPGHEALIAKCKADPACTPDMAAGQIIAAEKALRGSALDAIKGVETAAAAVKPAPSASAPSAPAASTASTPDGWKAEFAAQTPAGEKLRAEFASVDDYVGFKANESKVRILGARK